MRSVEITLGGVAYTVAELPVRKNSAWRKQLNEPFGELVDLIQRAPQTELTNAKDISELLRSLSGLLLGSIDLIADLLFAYSPGLAAQREYIEAKAYESELMDVFASVLTLAIPFGSLASRVTGVIQQMQAPTSPNKPTSTS